MKLAHPDWCHTLEWDALHQANLVLEDPLLYREVVADLTAQVDGGEGELILSDQGNIISLSKEVLLIRDLWAVDCNSKKLLHGIYSQLEQLAKEEYFDKIISLKAGLSDLMDTLIEDSDFSLEWTALNEIQPLFKLLGVKLERESEPLERLVDVARLSQSMLGIRCLILVGVRDFLTEQEYQSLCVDLTMASVSALFIDASEHSDGIQGRKLIIDKDRCELAFP